MNDREVWSLVCAWICELTGLVAIKAYEGEDRPPKPYIAVNFTRVSEVRERAVCVEYETLATINDAGFNEIQAAPVLETEWQYTVEVYGDDTTTALRKIRSAHHLYQSLPELDRSLVLFDVSDINYTPKFINGVYERRAQLKIQMRGFSSNGLLINTIEEAPVNFTRN